MVSTHGVPSECRRHVRSHSIPMNSIKHLCSLAAIVAASLCAVSATTRAQSEPHNASRTLHGVLTQAQLTPPLHARLRELRFSPNGAYILLQDQTTLYVINRSPLSIQLSIPARLGLPARFSADSSTLIVGTRDMTVAKINIAQDKEVMSRKLGTVTDCSVAALSPHGTYYACADLHLGLHVFRIDSGEEIFSGHEDVSPMAGPAVGSPISFVTGPSYSESAFSRPIGAVAVLPLDSVASSQGLIFSPDENYLLSSTVFGAFAAVDLEKRKAIKVGSPLKRAMETHGLEFVGPNRVVYVAPYKQEDSAVFSFPQGKLLTKFGFAGSARTTSNPNYLAYLTPDGKVGELVDLRTFQPATQISKDGADVLGVDIASYIVDQGLVFSHLGADHQRTLAKVPAGPLPEFQTAIASPDLHTIALSVSGQGALYHVADGKQIASFPAISGGWFDTEKMGYFRLPTGGHPLPGTTSVDTDTGKTQDMWEHFVSPLDMLRFSGPVLLAETMAIPVIPFYTSGPQKISTYSFDRESSAGLHGINLATGETLWTKPFNSDQPLVFTDPQGDRVVLAWLANSAGARKAVSFNPAAKAAFEGTKKLSGHETVFEILDARTGRTLDAAFVPGGFGPQGYSSAFSEGDWLVMVRDDMRITGFSLSSGMETLHLTAFYPSISAKTDLLAAIAAGGQLLLCDLKTGAKRSTQTFLSDVAYTRFSGDGRRLLVLTQTQELYVLDVAAAIAPQDDDAK
jgi:WD40 repeat protein